ncbi:MAG: energy-coupling factor transporter ATPase, partial [Oscillospiraceae bacterium]
KVLVMNKSSVEFFGTVNEVFEKVERLTEIGLNVPEVTKIFMNIKKAGIPVRTDIYTLEKAKQELLKLLREGGIKQ